MNSNWGLVDPLPGRVRDKKEKRRMLAARALDDFLGWLAEVDLDPAVDPVTLRGRAAAPSSEAPAP
jgi:hypothetical protein